MSSGGGFVLLLVGDNLFVTIPPNGSIGTTGILDLPPEVSQIICWSR